MDTKQYTPFKYGILIGILILIIPTLITFSILNYISTRQALLESHALSQMQTEANIINSLRFTDNGYKMFERALEQNIQQAFIPFDEAYEAAGQDPSQLDLLAIQADVEESLGLKADIYLINPEGIVEYTTFAKDEGLDLSQFTNFFSNITRIRENGEFAADRFTTETQTGQLRKYAYQATSDRRYLMEIGITTDEFQGFISEFDELTIADVLETTSPALEQVRTFDGKAYVLGDKDAVVSEETAAVVAELWGKPNARQEVEDRANRLIKHYIFVDLRDDRYASDASRVVELVYTTELIDNALARQFMINSVIGLLAIALTVGLAFILAKRISDPVQTIVTDVEAIAQGDLERRVSVEANNELRVLEGSINSMVDNINDYIGQLKSAEAERLRLSNIEQELKLAREIQQNLLPPATPQWTPIDAICYTASAHEMGGDLYNYQQLDPNRFALAIGDVSGKGMPAALLMSVALASFRSMLDQNLSPKHLLANLNKALLTYTETTRQNCALVYSEITAPQGSAPGALRTANAGCVFPLIRRTNGKMEWVEVFGLPLGVHLTLDFDYTDTDVPLYSGDLIVFTSDGVVEAMNSQREMFGFVALSQAVAEGPTSSAQAMLDHLRDQIQQFVGEADPHDDLTIVVVKV
ncbi:MAG: SpoIIE family protein phosphatase [Chloroflexota bacterium]